MSMLRMWSLTRPRLEWNQLKEHSTDRRMDQIGKRAITRPNFYLMRMLKHDFIFATFNDNFSKQVIDDLTDHMDSKNTLCRRR